MGLLPAIVHRSIPGLIGLHQYEDVFEKLARWEPTATLFRDRMRRQIDDVIFSKRCVFIHVPKNGGTSISSALYGHSTAHRTAYFYRTVAPDFFSGAEPFALLRDPVERFLSAYWFIRNGGGEDVAISPAFAKTMPKSESLDELISFTAENINNVFNLYNVLRPQVWYLCDDVGQQIVDNLFVIGRNEQVLSDFLLRHGVTDIPRRNRTKKGDVTVTDSQRRQVLAIYEHDVAMIENVRKGR